MNTTQYIYPVDVVLDNGRTKTIYFKSPSQAAVAYYALRDTKLYALPFAQIEKEKQYYLDKHKDRVLPLMSDSVELLEWLRENEGTQEYERIRSTLGRKWP